METIPNWCSFWANFVREVGFLENLDLEKISGTFLNYFENLGIPKDSLLIISIIIFLIFEKSDDYIMILILVLLIN